MPPPPAPTPTTTPTPYPTAPPAAFMRTDTPTPASSVCSFKPDEPFQDKSNTVRGQLGCGSGKSTTGAFAFQAFVGGFMFDDLRDNKNKTIYVFFADHTYRQFSDSWKDGSSEDSCPDISPSIGVKPIRGFGKVWCENSDVRDKLMGATAIEEGVTLFVQRFEHGSIWAGSSVVPAILDDGTWQ